ncbi:MAG: hypothetical protein ABSC94_30800 [Polyangiaceae bacterium]
MIRFALLFPLVAGSIACGGSVSNGGGDPPSAGVAVGAQAPASGPLGANGLGTGASAGGGASTDAADDDGEANIGPTLGGSASCPARGNAGLCPAVPAIVAPPVPPKLPPGSPDVDSTWVGCQYTSCSSAAECTTCTCVAMEAGAAWDCGDAGGPRPEADAQPTPYCSLYSGPIDAGDAPGVGPVEECTPEYPTCSGPSPESPGWQCCLITAWPGGVTEISCMPNDAAAYAGNFPP